MPEPDHIGETGRMAPESIEHAMLRAVGERLFVDLAPRTLTVGNGLRVEVEGIDVRQSVLVQLVPTVGVPKSHHRNKAMADMFKLVWMRQSLPTHPRLVLCISEPLARFFSPASWPSTAARDLGVDVFVYGDGVATDLLGAQVPS
jgi:hypothetical protein